MCRIVKVAGILLALTLIGSSLLLTACGGGGGSKIAFTSTRNSVSAIYVMNEDGSSQTRLTSGGTAQLLSVMVA